MVVVDEGHEEGPDGVVEENGGGDDEHCEAYYAVELWLGRDVLAWSEGFAGEMRS